MTQGKTYNKSPRRINHKATRSKTNTGTTALERSVEQTTGGFKAHLQLAYFTLGPDATLQTTRVQKKVSYFTRLYKHGACLDIYSNLDMFRYRTLAPKYCHVLDP